MSVDDKKSCTNLLYSTSIRNIRDSDCDPEETKSKGYNFGCMRYVLIQLGECVLHKWVTLTCFCGDERGLKINLSSCDVV